MNKSIFIKLLICSIFIVVLSSSFCVSSSYALGDIFSKGKGFLEAGNDIDQTINTTALEETSDTIYNTLLAIAIMVAIIVAMVLGIQFMVASADEKAKVKEAVLPFVVGCIVVFGSFTIWKIVVNIGNDAEDSIEATTIRDDEVPQISGIDWSAATNAQEYIDAGGDLTKVDDATLKTWYGQLSRQSGNFGRLTEYYEKVKKECDRRGFW